MSPGCPVQKQGPHRHLLPSPARVHFSTPIPRHPPRQGIPRPLALHSPLPWFSYQGLGLHLRLAIDMLSEIPVCQGKNDSFLKFCWILKGTCIHLSLISSFQGVYIHFLKAKLKGNRIPFYFLSFTPNISTKSLNFFFQSPAYGFTRSQKQPGWSPGG